MRLTHVTAIALVATASMPVSPGAGPALHQAPEPSRPWLVAHRGASAYAPENTVPAFVLAAEQGATFVEFDLRLTKDGAIVCLHDDSLERTTNVEDVFPERRRTGSGSGAAGGWPLEDYTLAELKRLDAGEWFDPKFRGTRLPTFGEAIESLRGRSGLFIELKSPERYAGIEQMVLAELQKAGLDKPGADPKTPVLLQSFTASSLEIFTRTLQTRLPVHFVFGARDAARWITPEGLAKVRTFATGISPEKTVLRGHPEVAAAATQLGLRVTPYTFRAGAVQDFPDVSAEMAHYLDVVQVDGVITDNPDRMPTRASR